MYNAIDVVEISLSLLTVRVRDDKFCSKFPDTSLYSFKRTNLISHEIASAPGTYSIIRGDKKTFLSPGFRANGYRVMISFVQQLRGTVHRRNDQTLRVTQGIFPVEA